MTGIFHRCYDVIPEETLEFFMTEEKEKSCNPCQDGHSLGMIKDKEGGTYFLGCVECREPLITDSSGKPNLEIKKKASPIC